MASFHLSTSGKKTGQVRDKLHEFLESAPLILTLNDLTVAHRLFEEWSPAWLSPAGVKAAWKGRV